MALTSSFVRAVHIVMCAGSVGAVSIPAAAQSPAPQAQEVRAELDKLRKEFEAVRDDYAARLAALESKLAAIGAPPAPTAPAPPAPPAPAAPAQAAVPAEVPVPSGAGGAGGPTGSLPVYGSTSALSKIFNPDIAVIGNFVGAAGENSINPPPALALDEAEA